LHSCLSVEHMEIDKEIVDLLSTFRWKDFPGIFENSTVKESATAMVALSVGSATSVRKTHPGPFSSPDLW